MKCRPITLVLATVMCCPVVAQAAPASNFLRDRNIPVAERTPKGFEPVGIRLGAFTAYPEVNVGVVHDDNIFYDDTNKASDSALAISPQVRVFSGWGRHDLRAYLSAQSLNFSKYDTEDTTTVNGGVSGRLDIGRASNLNFSLAATRGYESRANPTSPRGVVEPIEFSSTLAHVGGVAEFNRFRFTGGIDRASFEFENGVDALGNPVIQRFRDFDRSEITLRGDYAISPATAVYGVYRANTRDYDLTGTVNRNSDGYDLAAGVAFDITSLLTGEVELGYLKQTYDNPAFSPTEGGTWRARLSYFPTQLTNLTLTSTRLLGEAPDVSASGILSVATTLRVDHELRRNLVLTAQAAKIDDRYYGVDRDDSRDSIYLGAKYLASPRIVVQGGYTHSKLESKGAIAVNPYTDNRFELSVGLRF